MNDSPHYRRVRLTRCVLFSLAATVLGACTSPPKTLYEWGDYPRLTQSYLRADGDPPDAQIQALQVGLQEIAQAGHVPPPGYNAHLGWLYAQQGDASACTTHLTAEKTQFPESSTFIDFLLQKLHPSERP